jgi:uncharacterized protein YgiM (DUF1202 family)
LEKKKMQTLSKIPAIAFIAALLAALSPPAPAQEPAAGEMDFPYIAEITADNVHIRSGPGTNYYSCGKLNTSDKVKVVSREFSWSRIVPPPGSFSWISARHVKKNDADPRAGDVDGDSVRVYAGSPDRKPIHSNTLQLKLNDGDKVTLLGTEQDGYLKIAPPSGAYLWVSTPYTRRIGGIRMPSAEPKPAQEPKPEPEPAQELAQEQAQEPKPQPAPEPAVMTADAAIPLQPLKTKAERMQRYKMLEKLIEAEKHKEIADQEYGEIKRALGEIIEAGEADKAARFAEFTMGQLQRYETAAASHRQVQLQNRQLQQTAERIALARSTRLDQFRDLGRFAAVGRFKPSSVYGPEKELKRYIILDPAGKIVCYAEPTGPAQQVNLAPFVDRNVGLVGTIRPHPEIAGALVTFEEIAVID